MSGSTWFTLSIGRKDRADPKWILPLICKAGNVTRSEVGSIKISDNDTRFEISANKAGEFAAKIARDGSGQSGVTITSGAVATHAQRPSGPPAKNRAGPSYKVRTDKGEKLSHSPTPDNRGERSGKPPRSNDAGYKGDTGFKGKPKFKPEAKAGPAPERRAHEGEGKKHPTKPPRKDTKPHRGR